ncbi:MAG TPA: VWA domain-containing protein [Lacipirellulaceae bacterium]|nr:VWA domain-containing protein [Lacipirellulaceae bacterium]
MKRTRTNARRPSRQGAMMVLIAICLPLCVIMAAFAIDVAWMQLVRSQLRTSTDAAARAGAKELSLAQSISAARKEAKAAAKRNLVAGEPLLLANRDIEFGNSTQPSDDAKFVFTPGGSKPNAVRVTGQRTKGSLDGPVNLLFAGALGIRQFEPKEQAVSTQLDRDICLVVDRSGSMMWTLAGGSQLPPGAPNCGPPDPTRSRWGALNIALQAFLDQLEETPQDEHVALVSYSSNTFECGYRYTLSDINSDLVSDYTVIRNVMKDLSSRPVKGETDISAGIDNGIKVLTGKKARPFAVKTMIVMTDGIHNLGPEPILSAQNAAKKDIVIHTITFSADADIKRMEAVAAATGGKHFHAPTAEALKDIFQEIAATLPVMLTN